MGRVGRIYLEACIVGVSIALTVLLLRAWLGESSTVIRFGALLIAGGALCGLQYGLSRWRG